jgi:hypothetical protein
MTMVYDHKFEVGARGGNPITIVGATLGDSLFQAVLSALDVYLITSLGLFLCSKFPDSRWEARIKSVVLLCTVSTLVLSLGGGLWDDLKHLGNVTSGEPVGLDLACSDDRWIVLVGPDIIRVIVSTSLLWQQYQMRIKPDGIDALYRRRRESTHPGEELRSELELCLERSGLCDIYYNVWRRHELRRPGLLVAAYVLSYAAIDIFCVIYFELGPSEEKNTTLCYLYLNQVPIHAALTLINAIFTLINANCHFMPFNAD